MKPDFLLITLLILIMLFGNVCSFEKHKDQTSNDRSATEITMQQILIDKFIVPDAAKAEFLQRMQINVEFIKKQPGLVEITAYEKSGGEGEFNFLTVAVWENEEALAKAKQAVTDEYRKQGFDMPEMLKRLNIKIERAIYIKLEA